MTVRLVAVLLLVECSAIAQQGGILGLDSWSGFADVRNRWVSDIHGSSQVYRSVVNLGEGPRLLEGDLRFDRPGSRWADSASLMMTSWGGDPYNTARFTAQKRNLYDLRFGYRNIAYFNNLPSFANPLLRDGLTLSQRAYDIRRRQADLDLKLRPGRKLSPFVAFSNSSSRGDGITGFVADGDEFGVRTAVKDRLLTARAGITATGSRWSVTLEQGVTDFSDKQRVSWGGERLAGNRRFPLLGRETALDRLFQQYAVDGGGSFSRATVQAQPWSRVAVSGQFVYSQPEIESTQDLEAEGEFVFLPLLAAYSMAVEHGAAQASRPRSSGSWSTELRLHRKVRFVQSWLTDRFDIAGSAALAATLGTEQELQLETRLDRRLAVDFNQTQLDLIVEPDRRISLRAGHRYSWGAAETTAPDFDLRLTPKTEGLLRRRVELASVAGRLINGRLRVGAQGEMSSASSIYFRTGLKDYWRAKLRGSYELLPSLTLHSSYRAFENQNDDPEIALDVRSRQLSAGFSWAPGGRRDLLVSAEYARSRFSSQILAIQLPFFGSNVVDYLDRGHAGSVFVQSVAAYGLRVKAGGSLFVGSGSRPTRFYTPQAELEGSLTERLRWVGEWRWYGFSEEVYPVEDFRSHTFSAGLRINL